MKYCNIIKLFLIKIDIFKIEYHEIFLLFEKFFLQRFNKQ